MSEDLLKDLFKKYLDENISAEEFSQLYSLIRTQYNQESLDLLLQETLTDPAYAVQTDEEDKRALFAELLDKMGPEKVVPMYRQGWFRWAAAAVVVVVAGSFYWYAQHKTTGGKPQTARFVKVDAPAGRTGAILTLADGSKVQLDSTADGSITIQGLATLSKQGGVLNYQEKKGQQETALQNTLTTPRGRQFELKLSDGTKVWLNAASSITYPAHFTGKERQVKVSGEAYFEVSPDQAHPFRVQLAKADILVLGTHFNVMDYEDEQAIHTTLLEGSVKLVRDQEELLLTPGQDGRIDRQSGKWAAHPADTASVIAWTRGRLAFSNADFSEVMRQISRWYDVDIQFQGEVPEVHIGGIIKRNVNLSTVMEFLTENGVHFQAEGKKIVILPK